jgi:hypothetical protein
MYVLPSNADSMLPSLILSGSGLLKPPVAAAFEAETNRLPRADIAMTCPPTPPPFFFLTFANDTQRVDLWEAGGCGQKTNGVMSVEATTKWLNALHGYVLPARHG